MQQKIVFIDCDDTLIFHGEDESYIPESARYALAEIKKNGHIVSISSGRSTFQVEQLMSDLKIDNAICFNGHMVISNNVVIHDDPIDQMELQPLIEQLINCNKVVFAVDTEYMYVNDPTGQIAYFITNKMRPGYITNHTSFIKNIKQIDTRARKYYLFMVFDNEFSCLDINKSFRNLEIKHWSGVAYEVMNRATSKFSGVNLMIKHLNIDHENTYAFGDSYNDIEMIKGVKYGIAMGNSPEALKRVADYVTDSVEENGFYKACKHLKLI